MSNLEEQVSLPIEGYLQVGSPAKIFQSPERELGWMEREAASTGKSSVSSTKRRRNGSSSKTSLVYLQVSEEQTWEQSSERWLTGGMALAGECWMLKTLEFPSGGGVSSSLRDVLETSPVSQKYYLSAKACEGIIRRAERRGKKLPETLDRALRSQLQYKDPSSGVATALGQGGEDTANRGG